MKIENIGKNDIVGRYVSRYRDDGKVYENSWRFTRVPVTLTGVDMNGKREGWHDRVLGKSLIKTHVHTQITRRSSVISAMVLYMGRRT